DGDGLPLAFRIFPGNQNEQTSLKPLEQTILSDFDLSQFVVCTDAGLASQANRRFNHQGQRAYVTTKSLKQLPAHLKDWALDPTGWHRAGSEHVVALTDLDDTSGSDEFKHLYYKDRWIHENGLEEHLVVTFSFKHRDYQRSIRAQQILRAQDLQRHPQSVLRARQTDPKRFLVVDTFTPDGELAAKKRVRFDPAVAEREARYDGFYAVVTDLEGDPEQIVRINQGRWQIEQCFRILKSEFKARPAYLSRDNRLAAHFLTCFMALLIYRQLEYRVAAVSETDSVCGSQLMEQLRQMDFYR
ncbi:transposase, partial [Oscillospiraceae bacterium HV4-5-C5C]|nr:transposase [Oscillospiraceae bacterium HV4-5-C5C]